MYNRAQKGMKSTAVAVGRASLLTSVQTVAESNFKLYLDITCI